MRRVRVEKVRLGEIQLSEREAHHARNVLRLAVGVELQLFDEAGGAAVARIVRCDAKQVIAHVEQLEEIRESFQWWVAAGIPKGTRVDWIVEKLSELGTSRF